MGAWIEMSITPPSCTSYPTSHPLWVRGLKLASSIVSKGPNFVAPFMGAWIEIKDRVYRYYEEFASHPLWVRGLK